MSTAIVTGGAKGIGKAIVEELARDGINVVVNYNTSKEQAIKLKQELQAKGQNIEIYRSRCIKKRRSKRTSRIRKK